MYGLTNIVYGLYQKTCHYKTKYP